jgi:hypothetical protein
VESLEIPTIPPPRAYVTATRQCGAELLDAGYHWPGSVNESMHGGLGTKSRRVEVLLLADRAYLHIQLKGLETGAALVMALQSPEVPSRMMWVEYES